MVSARVGAQGATGRGGGRPAVLSPAPGLAAGLASGLGQFGRYGPGSSSSSSGPGADGNGSAIPAGFQMYSGPDGESPGRD